MKEDFSVEDLAEEGQVKQQVEECPVVAKSSSREVGSKSSSWFPNKKFPLSPWCM
jgi:hypothetical protein